VAWVLRLTDVINGWVFVIAAAVLAVGLQIWVAGRSKPGLDVPVEWWGVRRPYRAGDEEVLLHGLAGG
jgi:branched-chain amino acid transport system permease protein